MVLLLPVQKSSPQTPKTASSPESSPAEACATPASTRSTSRNSRGSSNTPCTTLKIAVFAPNSQRHDQHHHHSEARVPPHHPAERTEHSVSIRTRHTSIAIRIHTQFNRHPVHNLTSTKSDRPIALFTPHCPLPSKAVRFRTEQQPPASLFNFFEHNVAHQTDFASINLYFFSNPPGRGGNTLAPCAGKSDERHTGNEVSLSLILCHLFPSPWQSRRKRHDSPILGGGCHLRSGACRDFFRLDCPLSLRALSYTQSLHQPPWSWS